MPTSEWNISDHSSESFLWSANEFNTIGLCSRYRIAFVSAAASGWCGSFYSQWMHSIDDYVHYGPFLILTTVYFPSLLSTANIFLKIRSVLCKIVIWVTLYCSVLENTASIHVLTCIKQIDIGFRRKYIFLNASN